MTDIRKVKQCGHCGVMWELEDCIDGFQCNCSIDQEDFEDSLYCEECDSLMIDTANHTQKSCEEFKKSKNYLIITEK